MSQSSASGSARLPKAAEVPREELLPRRQGKMLSMVPSPQSFLLVIHPLPHSRLVFFEFFYFPSFLLSQTVGVAGAARRGFEWLASFHGFAKTRLSLAHLSLSVTSFSVLGSGMSVKNSHEGSPGLGACPPGRSVVPGPVVATTTLVSSRN